MVISFCVFSQGSVTTCESVLERRYSSYPAFVDIGVKQDGLVHISNMMTKYVKSPLEVVQVGDIIDVKVLSVDLERERIALSMKIEH